MQKLNRYLREPRITLKRNIIELKLMKLELMAILETQGGIRRQPEIGACSKFHVTHVINK